MTLLWALALASVISANAEVFYNTASQKLFTKTSGSLFGFSVSSVFSGPRSYLVVGAPRADLKGDVFTCNLNTGTSCDAVDKSIIEIYLENLQAYKNESYWFGATVKGNDKFFVGCAPHLIDKTIGNDFNGVGTFGQCYASDTTTQVQNKVVYLTATRNKPTLRDNKLMEQTLDTFGWGLDIIDSSSDILAGSPVLTSGMVFKRNFYNLNETAIPVHKTGSDNGERFNFGYSVAAFRAKSKSQYYAVGSTYHKGSVTYFPENDKQSGRGKPKWQKKNMQKLKDGVVGSMYGATLCTAMLGEPALLVGSPACPDKDSYNVGSVYVYISNDNVETPHTLVKTIFGDDKQSFFGSAIASLGDLNGDRKDEIAIGAPYEKDGQGAVYIYSGAKLTSGTVRMEAKDCQQKIEPSPSYKTFGYSLAALRDYDDNGCNELAIGIPESSTVMVLRCAAAIAIEFKKFSASLSKSQGLSKAETVKLPVCFKATFPDKPKTFEADVNVKINIQHEDVTLQDGKQTGPDSTITKTIKITEKKEEYCENIYITLKANGKYHNKIFYGLSATLTNDPMTEPEFKPSHIKLADNIDTSLSGTIWVQECGNAICKPELSIVTSYSAKSPYIMGSSDTIDVTTSVTNAGDVAYDTCVTVVVEGAQALPTEDCKLIQSTDGLPLGVQCRPKQVLRGTGPWKTTVAVDTTQLTNLDDLLFINVTLYELCNDDKKIKSNTKEVFKLFPDTQSVAILGRTDEGISDIVNMTKSDIASRKSFEHVYTISNTGATKWKNVHVYLELDKQDFVTSSVANDSAKCELRNDNSTTAGYSCVLATLEKIDIKVMHQVVPDILSGRIGKENLTVHSKIHVHLNSTTTLSKGVLSELRLVEAAVPIWIIIAASILALIILVIIFFILRECGFLKRKNKEELRKARMSVRRQTVLRKTMMSPRSDDQEILVEADVASAVARQGKQKKDHRVVVKDS